MRLISLGQVECIAPSIAVRRSLLPPDTGGSVPSALFLENMSSKSNERRWLCLITNYVQRGRRRRSIIAFGNDFGFDRTSAEPLHQQLYRQFATSSGRGLQRLVLLDSLLSRAGG